MNVLRQIQNTSNEITVTIVTTIPILYGVHSSNKSYLNTSIDLAYHYAMALGVAEADCNQTYLNMTASITYHFTGEKWDVDKDDKMVVVLIERMEAEDSQKYRPVQE